MSTSFGLLGIWTIRLPFGSGVTKLFRWTRPEPIAKTRSALTRNVAASRVIVLAAAPTERGWVSGKALLAAIEVATKWGEDLVLVYGAAPPGGMGEEAHSHRDALMEMGRTATAHALDKATAAGVTTTVRLVNAKPAEALVAVGDELDATVIVVGTAGDSPFRGVK